MCLLSLLPSVLFTWSSKHRKTLFTGSKAGPSIESFPNMQIPQYWILLFKGFKVAYSHCEQLSRSRLPWAGASLKIIFAFKGEISETAIKQNFQLRKSGLTKKGRSPASPRCGYAGGKPLLLLCVPRSHRRLASFIQNCPGPVRTLVLGDWRLKPRQLSPSSSSNPGSWTSL